MKTPEPKQTPLRTAALIAIPLGALGSIGFMLHVGQRNPSRLLLALFTGWVLAPFLALAWSHVAAKPWPESAQAWLHRLTLVLALTSLAVYGYAAFGPPLAKPAFPFLVVPFASLVLLALIAVLLTRTKEKPSRPQPPTRAGGPRI